MCNNIVTCGPPRGRSLSPGRGEILLFSMSSRPVLGSIHSLGVKRPGRETEDSPPTSSEVKNTWICTSSLPYAGFTVRVMLLVLHCTVQSCYLNVYEPDGYGSAKRGEYILKIFCNSIVRSWRLPDMQVCPSSDAL
jgi:hypothetical protein